MKKIVLVVTLVLSVFLVTGCSEQANNDIDKIGFVTDTAGLGDLAFNDAVHEGVKQAAEDFGYELVVLESSEIADYENNIRSLINDGVDVVIVAANAMIDVVNRLAPEYPDTKFLTFDMEIPDIENVSATLFREQEAAFLLGVFAGFATTTDTVGYVGGIESPLQERALNGFKAGFMTVNEGEVLDVYAGTYGDPGLGKDIGDSLFGQGADFVAAFAGAVNLGVFQSAADLGDGHYALGAALGQFELNPEVIVASQVKTINMAVYTAIEEFHNGGFESGLRSAGIAENGVNLLLNPDSDLVSSVLTQEQLDQIDAFRDQIIAGEIDVPTTSEELDNYQP